MGTGTIAIIISAVGVFLSMAATGGGGLVVVSKVSSVVGGLLEIIKQLKDEIVELKKMRERTEAVPLIAQTLEQIRQIVDDHSRKLSEFPRMRERLDSVAEDVRDAQLPQLQTRVAVVEKVMSTRSMPAVRLPREEPGK
jgi:hypothetical protein